MATIELTISPQPSHVRMVRLVAVGVARRAGVDEALLDEVRLAVGEACSRAVALHARRIPQTPVEVRMLDEPETFSVVVADRAGGAEDSLAGGLDALDAAALGAPEAEPRQSLPSGFGLAVIAGLVDDCAVERDGGGTTVVLTWKAGAPASGPSGH